MVSGLYPAPPALELDCARSELMMMMILLLSLKPSNGRANHIHKLVFVARGEKLTQKNRAVVRVGPGGGRGTRESIIANVAYCTNASTAQTAGSLLVC